MHDAKIVRSRDTRAEVARHVQSLVTGQTADAPQQAREILSVDVLHRDEMGPLPFEDVVKAADIRMRHLASDPYLGMQVLEASVIVDNVTRKGI